MGPNTTEIERAVARTLRDSLQKLQHTSDEVSQAVGDLVSACASARPGNALPHLVRAQTAAASLAASLDVLSRFITGALQPGWNVPAYQAIREEDQEPQVEHEQVRDEQNQRIPVDAVISEHESEAPPLVESQPADQSEVPEASENIGAADFQAPTIFEEVTESTVKVAKTAAGIPEAVADIPEPVAEVFEPVAEESAQAFLNVAADGMAAISDSAEGAAAEPPSILDISDPMPVAQAVTLEAAHVETPIAPIQPVATPEHPIFEVAALPPDQQELHRRANRVAKVTMQDIKMLRPRDVELGKQNHDICARLRDDIERAHKEYERRFQAILDHPVDYFHAWMVEILAEGDSCALGEYPYHSPVLQR